MQKQPTLFVLVQPKGRKELHRSLAPGVMCTAQPYIGLSILDIDIETQRGQQAGEEIRAHLRYCRYHHDHREYRYRRCEWWR